MAQIPKARLVKGPCKPICRDCAIYFSITVSSWFDFARGVLVAPVMTTSPSGNGTHGKKK